MTFYLLNQIKSHKIRSLKTLNLFLTYVTLGLSASVVGPTLLDLRQAVNANALQISIIFPVGSVGYLIGSIAGGLVYERFDSQLTMALFVFILSFGEALIPWNRSVVSLSANQFVMGFGGGALDTAANVWLLHMWGKKSAPFMQTLHFTFGLGAFIAPLIAEPFLANKNDFNAEGEEMEVVVGSGELMIWYPYTIIAGLGIMTFISLLVMYFVKSSDKPHPSIEDNRTSNDMSLRKKFLILFIASLIFHCYCGLEIAFGRFITSYVYYSDLHLNKSIGAYMTSVFWGTFTLCRLLTVFIVDFVGTKAMIFTEILIIIVGNVILIIFGNTSEMGVWIGISLMGIGSSSIWPTLFSFIEELIPITSRIGTLFCVFSCLGEFTIPLIIGFYIEKYPFVLVIVTSIASVICFVFFIFLLFISKLNKTVYQKQNTTEDDLNEHKLKSIES